MEPELPTIGIPINSTPLTWVRDIEYYDGPLLSEFLDSDGISYLEKWCSCDYSRGVQRYLRVSSTQHAIQEYMAGRMSMLDLLTKPNEDIGILVDYAGGKIVGSTLALVSDLASTKYLPEPDAMYDETLQAGS